MVQDDVISSGLTGQNLRRGDVTAASADKCWVSLWLTDDWVGASSWLMLSPHQLWFTTTTQVPMKPWPHTVRLISQGCRYPEWSSADKKWSVLHCCGDVCRYVSKDYNINESHGGKKRKVSLLNVALRKQIKMSACTHWILWWLS